MAINRKTRQLYKEILFVLVNHYPGGSGAVRVKREQLKRAFMENRSLTDPSELAHAHTIAENILRQLQDFCRFHRYRVLTKQYEDDGGYSKE